MKRHIALLLTSAALLAGCGGADNPEAGNTTHASVAVTTTVAARHVFYRHVDAWGTTATRSASLQHLNLAVAGQINSIAVSPGQSVAQHDLLLRVTTDPAARRDYQQAESALASARSEFERTQALRKDNLATAAELAAARKTLDDARAALAAERALGSDRPEHALRAPAAGVVQSIHVSQGERVSAGQALVDFSPSRGLIAQLGVQPGDAATLKTGMPVHIATSYPPEQSGMGALIMVGRAVDAGSHLVRVQASLPADMMDSAVEGMPIKARIRTDQLEAWAVPRNAVVSDDKGHYLFQLNNGHAVRKSVKLLFPQGNTVGVSAALDSALPVIVTGAYELSDGDAVRERSR